MNGQARSFARTLQCKIHRYIHWSTYSGGDRFLGAHVILCWLALLLARIAENACGSTWPRLRRELDRIAVGTFTGPAGTFRQRTEISEAQAAILGQMKIDPPPKIYELTPAAPR
jgi:hypothetical protein